MPRNVNPGTIRVGSGRNADKSLDSNSFTTPVVNSARNGVKAHVSEPKSSHAASSISVSPSEFFNSDDVAGVLDEVSALLPTRPPNVGEFSKIINFSGITDWGVLKLRDAGLGERGDLTFPDPNSPNDDLDIYPTFHVPPKVADTVPPFEVSAGGNDPETDLVFNVFDGLYSGGGTGTTHFGGFPRDVVSQSDQIISQSARLLPSEGIGAKSFVLSGSIYPADRGVLALFYWPPEGTVLDFLTQDLTVRVVAALNLGKGLVGQSSEECDGDLGGIFTGDPKDPFQYPGQATGQYDLVELHSAQVGGTGATLPAPFDVPNPAAGQVRLGTSVDAGVPLVVGGIPILGATAIATGGGNAGNFFRYRLPYLADYSTVTGLVNTPEVEKFRYFEKPAISLDPVEDLTQSGNYTDFSANYWSYQIARYRHRATFPTGFPNPPVPRDMGSYILIHFKTERDFEFYARDGVLPNTPGQCYEVYSANLTNWADPEDNNNLANGSETGEGYHVVRARNYEDPSAVDSVTFDTGSFTYSNSPNEVMPISGVFYFTPGTTSSSPWTIQTMDATVLGFWRNTFRTSELDSTGAVTAGLGSPNPAMLYLGRFGYEPGKILHAAEIDFDGQVKAQRLEFGYDKLDSGSTHGAFSLLNSPKAADSAEFELTGTQPVGFVGDVNLPQFSTDAKIRLFMRAALGFQEPETSFRPNNGSIIPVSDGIPIMFYSSTETLMTQGIGSYGNVTVAPAGPFPSLARANLETPLKDYQERFLDEVYRYIDATLASIDPTHNGSSGKLTGPGFPEGNPDNINTDFWEEFPVRIGTNTDTYQTSSWLQQGIHLADLTTFQTIFSAPPEAQVAGLPDRNPPIEDGVTFSAPSSGVLIYPQDDYSNNAVRPSTTGGDLIGSFSQPDYSTITDPEVVYVRAFDVAMFRSVKSQDLNGQPLFSLIVSGLRLVDFEFFGIGPGSAKIAIMVKVPGYTTWMDMGRRDQSGPSKQDSALDGAGCQVFGSETFDFRDAETGVWTSQVRINVGPAANLYQNTVNETPVLVKVIMKVAGKDLNFEQGGADGTTDALRGLIGLEILREDKPEVVPFDPPDP